jgi:protein gp37
MASKIEWCDATWEPVLGCSPVSAGCDNCYAERLTWRLAHNPGCRDRYRGLVALYGGNGDPARAHPRWTGEVVCDEGVLEAPLHWRRPRRVFVCSRSDLFHEKVPESFIRAVFTTMARCPQHTFQVLTKRANRMHAFLSSWRQYGVTLRHGYGMTLPNVWLGVTVEDQDAANKRILYLLATPAAVRWVSFEPMLESVNLHLGRDTLDAWSAAPPIDWVVVGGESGPNARACDVEWIRDVVRQCREAGTACFVKQLGARCAGGIINSKGADPEEWPVDLRVREYPGVSR